MAAAEDVNTSLNDIAAALTGSMPTDGSAAFTGPVNFNGQSVSGIGNLGVNGNLTAGYISTPGNVNAGNAFTGGSVIVSGLIETTGGRIISEGPGNNPSVICYDVSQALAAGMFLGGGVTPDILGFGGADGNGNIVREWGWFDFSGNFNVVGSVTIGGVVAAGGGVTSNGNITAVGSITGDNITVNGQGIRYAGFAPFDHIMALGWNGANVVVWVDGNLVVTIPNLTAIGALEAHVDALEAEIAALRGELQALDHVPA